VLGLAFGKLIKTYLFHAVPVALASSSAHSSFFGWKDANALR